MTRDMTGNDTATMTDGAILQAEHLQVSFCSGGAIAQVVRGINLRLHKGKTLALVGESGCGKSVTSLALLRLLESPPARIAGAVRFGGVNLLELPEKEIRKRRGGEIAMIFQEPMTSLNPVFTVGAQIMEAVQTHAPDDDKTAWNKTVRALEAVGIPAPEAVAQRYPHELSGGMKQRAMIAMALACEPEVLIADEPTTALDVTVQAQILDLLRDLQNKRGLSMLFITHDLGVVAELAHEVAVMYAGVIVERAPVEAFFAGPLHPYAQALLKSVPQLTGERGKLYTIPGMVPSPTALPQGCKFAPRCPRADDRCRNEEPALTESGAGRCVACFHPGA